MAAITRTQDSGDDTIADNWTLATQGDFYFSHDNYLIGTKTSANGEGNTYLSWLVENTGNSSTSGATSNGTDNNGYWTLSPYIESGYANVVSRYGLFFKTTPNDSTNYGARPVITIPKTKLQ